MPRLRDRSCIAVGVTTRLHCLLVFMSADVQSRSPWYSNRNSESGNNQLGMPVRSCSTTSLEACPSAAIVYGLAVAGT